MTASKVMTLRILPLNCWLLLANRWSIPAARIMAATIIGLKSGSLKPGARSYRSLSVTFCVVRLA